MTNPTDSQGLEGEEQQPFDVTYDGRLVPVDRVICRKCGRMESRLNAEYRNFNTGRCVECNGELADYREPVDTQGDDELDKILSDHENLCEDQLNACGDCRRLKASIEALITKAKAEAVEEVLDELEKELPLSERLAWSDEDGSYMDVRVFNNNINIWIQAHRQSKRTPTEKK